MKPPVSAHPAFPDCLLCPAVDTEHAWRIMRALDSAGFRAGYPALPSSPAYPGIAVAGRVEDAGHVARVQAVLDSVPRA